LVTGLKWQIASEDYAQRIDSVTAMLRASGNLFELT
jgi:hypothetical protein